MINPAQREHNARVAGRGEPVIYPSLVQDGVASSWRVTLQASL